MTPQHFFDLFEKELANSPQLTKYYKIINSPRSYAFRKAYFMQRLEFIYRSIQNKNLNVWDVGCGYGTTAIFLALNGIKVHGSTLEFYFKEIEKRLAWWKQHGDVSKFTYGYENIFDTSISDHTFDVIILQDTLHHLEPINEAITILSNTLKPNGKLIISEVNGKNLFERLKYFKQRGNKKVIKIYDENLKKEIWFGNENIRSIETWNVELSKAQLEINNQSLEYIRMIPPPLMNTKNYSKIIKKEQEIWKKNNFLKKYFFFGINFIAEKK
ncbi:MAG: hypothetical protein RIQ89_1765 [Bacteroidota bacterium]|jgi:2-polyprenyl-3-methyl-5-hydroxy-6-metoxy-1,4-benzoquinol methylase